MSRSRAPFVLLPSLPAALKKQYKPVNETSLRAESETRVNEVIGEYREGNILYYYARYDGGIARRFPAIPFAEKYRDIVDKYRLAKAEGELEAFDPSAQYIHPLSRVNVKIRIRNEQNAPSTDGEAIVTSSEGEESEESYEDDDYNAPMRKHLSRRAKSTATKELPFSPRKSRLRKVMTFADSESDASDQKSGPIRRSTRSKVTKISLITDEEDYLDEDEKGKGKTKIKKFTQPKPMYGRIRAVTTIQDDPFPDDEEHEALRRHRNICEKCHLKPAHLLLAAFKKKSKGRGKKRKRSTDDDFEESEDEQKYIDMGGWVTCLKCPVSAHWKCLAGHQRDEVLKAVREKDRKEWETRQDNEDDSMPQKRLQLNLEETTEFVCGSCMRGGFCMGCMETLLEPDPSQSKSSQPAVKDAGDDDVIMESTVRSLSPVYALARELLFRCFTCKRLAHYSHLPPPPVLGPDSSVADIAGHYQQMKSWLCADCSSFRYGVDKILAWRPYPADAVEASTDPKGMPNYKAQLPREYLIKWSGRSYRRVQWVPHMWLVSTNPSKLKNFISGGSKVELLQEPTADQDAMEVAEPISLFEDEPMSRAASVKAIDDTVKPWLSALPDAERRIPLPWKNIDRVLDIVLWRPTTSKQAPRRTGRRTFSVGEDEEHSSNVDDERIRLIFDQGEEPPAHLTETVKEWETHGNLEKSDIDHVVWAFIKWEELGYDEATWDAPPRPAENNYESFKRAFDRFIDSRSVLLLKHNLAYWKVFDNRAADGFRKHSLRDASMLELGSAPNLKLLPFQVDGFNWLCNNWWNHQHCILADEMGLGKTVQIATFLGNIVEQWKAFPALVVVPNSTITNWVREFERWAPRLRVVPFYGEKNSRDVIKQFELFHETPQKGYTDTKFHVLVTTYESIINAKDFAPVFKKQPRWEVLIVDEGQRLKNDDSLLFKKLNDLNSIHRIIMTGTPLNNNIRELFNLMNFLDPEKWTDLEGLEKEHEVLDEELVKQLHNRLRPYFLRRIKSEVLQLPPKNEVIVPVSMAPLQKEVYRSILSKNLEVLSGLTKPSVQSAPARGRINNILMQLRKCLQHPYLYAEDLEPPNLSQQDAHEKLIDASAKLRFLKVLLPKLKEGGHRVLLFSQFVIALNVLEDFLNGEGYKSLRLDGSTKNKERQKAMDEYNKPGSEYFIFLLTTRAGGVGINLFSADTVIIFDPDFNPHQDLQAIARAYRYGQQKTCLVFKLMVKESAEERIMQIGKKKLVLDHLIVQKMDDDEDNGGENVQSILTYGAQALFESEETSRDITYTENDIDKLIEKTEKEAVPEASNSGGGLSFSFAKIWAADKDSLEEVQEDDQTDSWAQALQKITIEREKEQIKEIALSGRGARRRAADIAKTKMQVDPGKFNDKKTKGTSVGSDGSPYMVSDEFQEDDSDDDAMADGDFALNTKSKLPQASDMTKNNPLTSSSHNSGQQQPTIDCGLCGHRHGFGECLMVDRSENLAEYREMLILHADDEPWEERSAAIRAIDEVLCQRGAIALIAGQPLHPLVKELPSVPTSKVINPTFGTENSQVDSSKQASSSQLGGPRKKAKNAMPPMSSCPLCNQAPHLLKDCSDVRAGSKSISSHIRILESKNDPALMNTLNVLRNLLAKYKSQEIAAASTSTG
ncbi:hypothetical protein BYT27DRAFT_7189847 [Phlegmacium glaucopus]|nr:hypothetical protein BYT27DRAFT_7189847 [Phlegmacium glaucopus]